MRQITEEEQIVTVREIRVGDLVDLEGDPTLGHHPSVPFKYAEVVEIADESPDCRALYFDGMAAGYDPNQKMIIMLRCVNPYLDRDE